jgi:integrase
MRGDGGIYWRGTVLWIFYSFRGKMYRESAHTSDEKVAGKLLRQRLKQVERPGFVGPKEEKWTLADMKARLEADYARKENRSLKTLQYCFQHVEDAFPFVRVIDMSTGRIEKYVKDRLQAGAARASVNRELAYLRRGFKLMVKAGDISAIPCVIELLQGENVREGFLNRPEFDAICERLKPDVKDIVQFLYDSSWRSGEPKTLTWDKFDQQDWVFRLSRKNAKSKRPRTLTLVGNLREVIERRLEKRRPDCPYVFHRNGKPIKDFRKAFKAAAKEEGLEGLLPHDMRRSGIRNFTKAGLGESEGMSISGHETNSVYKRYNIIDEEMQRQALQRVQEQQRKEKESRRVVPLKRETA